MELTGTEKPKNNNFVDPNLFKLENVEKSIVKPKDNSVQNQRQKKIVYNPDGSIRGIEEVSPTGETFPAYQTTTPQFNEQEKELYKKGLENSLQIIDATLTANDFVEQLKREQQPKAGMGDVQYLESQKSDLPQNTGNFWEPILNTLGIEPQSQKEIGKIYQYVGDKFSEAKDAFDNGSFGKGTLKGLNASLELLNSPFAVADVLARQNPYTEFLAEQVNKAFQKYDELQTETYKRERGNFTPPEQYKEWFDEFDKLRKNVELIMLSEAGAKGLKLSMMPVAEKIGLDVRPEPIRQAELKIKELKDAIETNTHPKENRPLNLDEFSGMLDEVKKTQQIIDKFNEAFKKTDQKLLPPPRDKVDFIADEKGTLVPVKKEGEGMINAAEYYHEMDPRQLAKSEANIKRPFKVETPNLEQKIQQPFLNTERQRMEFPSIDESPIEQKVNGVIASADPKGILELKAEERRINTEFDTKLNKEPIQEITNPGLVKSQSKSIQNKVAYLNEAIREHNKQFEVTAPEKMIQNELLTEQNKYLDGKIAETKAQLEGAKNNAEVSRLNELLGKYEERKKSLNNFEANGKTNEATAERNTGQQENINGQERQTVTAGEQKGNEKVSQGSEPVSKVEPPPVEKVVGQETNNGGKKTVNKISKEQIEIEWKSKVEQAKKNIKSRGNNLNIGVDVTAIRDFAIVGADYIKRGAVKLSEFGKNMVSEFGNTVIPYVKKIYAEAKRRYEELQNYISENNVISQGIGKANESAKEYKSFGEYAKAMIKERGKIDDMAQLRSEYNQLAKNKTTEGKTPGAAPEKNTVPAETTEMKPQKGPTIKMIYETKQTNKGVIVKIDNKGKIQYLRDSVKRMKVQLEGGKPQYNVKVFRDIAEAEDFIQSMGAKHLEGNKWIYEEQLNRRVDENLLANAKKQLSVKRTSLNYVERALNTVGDVQKELEAKGLKGQDLTERTFEKLVHNLHKDAEYKRLEPQQKKQIYAGLKEHFKTAYKLNFEGVLGRKYQNSWYRNFGRKYFRQSLNVVKSMGEPGKELASRILKMNDDERMWVGRATGPLLEMGKLTKAEYKNLNEIRTAKRMQKTVVPKMQESNAVVRGLTKEQAELKRQRELVIPEYLNDKVKKADELLTEYYKSVADEFEKRGFTTSNVDTGDYYNFTPRKDYEPRVLSMDLEELEAIMGKDGVPKFNEKRNKLLQHLVETGKAKNKYEAGMKLDDFIQGARSSRAGNIEYARTFDLPEEFYKHDSSEVLMNYATTTGKRLSYADNFGREGAIADRLTEEIRDIGHDAEFVNDLMRYETGNLTEKERGYLDAVNKAKGFQSLTKFTPFTTLRNATQGFLGSTVRGNIKSGLYGLVKGIMPDAKKNAYLSGALSDSISSLVLTEIDGGNKVVRGYLKGIGFVATERFNRIVSSAAGEVFYNDMLKRIENNSILKRRAYREFEKLGLNTDEIVNRGKFTEDELNLIRRSFAGDAQFNIRPNDLPLFWSSPLGKLVTQWKSYGFRMTKLISDSVLKEAKAGNLFPLITYMAAFGVTGEAVSYTIDAVRDMFNFDPRKEGKSYYTPFEKSLIGRAKEGDWAGFTGRLVSDMASLGALSFFVDIIRTIGYGKTTEQNMVDVGSVMVGPTVMEVIKSGAMFTPAAGFLNDFDGEDVPERTLRQAYEVFMRNFPGAGTVRTFGFNKMLRDKIFGLKDSGKNNFYKTLSDDERRKMREIDNAIKEKNKIDNKNGREYLDAERKVFELQKDSEVWDKYKKYSKEQQSQMGEGENINVAEYIKNSEPPMDDELKYKLINGRIDDLIDEAKLYKDERDNPRFKEIGAELTQLEEIMKEVKKSSYYKNKKDKSKQDSKETSDLKKELRGNKTNTNTAPRKSMLDIEGMLR